ncbi:probable DNA-directed RNA polymerase I/III chain AC19 [Phialocephala subalpina]|jgi:DNA-directed RNA polymerase I and III subunit RPAC2|uniref:DNA-directed RNA polymerases I and III subunit RPAC2 n=1 Tax=Phialocephala subalpina TaxID=576137 RepID=A0A1L7X4V1_9HELO|nr:probable DNA-directed RNA polymerase I/III chain AC19 [Phialocephala subalpina]
MAPEAEDVSMSEAPMEEITIQEQRIRILPGSSETAASFEFKNEDHTLGNALRYIIMKNPDVEFCGYSIPHPSEAVMNIRIQTYDNTTAVQALEKGFDDLIDLCDIVDEKFRDAKQEFANRMEA